MTSVYHLMPRNLAGNTLHPLNCLKELEPEVYETHARKYRGREEVIARVIPILECLWNDVLFFSSVHPQAIKQGYLAVGKQWKPQNWIAVDTVHAGCNAENTVIYHPDMQRLKGDFSLDPTRFAPFSLDEVTTVDALPAEVLTYYQEAAKNDQPIFAWHGLPHILYRGSIDLTDVDVIEV